MSKASMSLPPDTLGRGSGCSALSDTPPCPSNPQTAHYMLGSIRDNGRKTSAFTAVFREVTRQLQFSGTGTLTAKLWEHRERILTQHQGNPGRLLGGGGIRRDSIV